MPVAALPILEVDATGKLTGATGVDVDGSLFDVVFLDDTCRDLFDGCDDPSDFVFQTSVEALTASIALLEQVFVDSIFGDLILSQH